MSGQELAAYWIEHVLRHNGTKHLQLGSKDLPFYQRHLLDVISFLVALALLILLFISAILYCLLSQCLDKGIKSKEKNNKPKGRGNKKTKTK